MYLRGRRARSASPGAARRDDAAEGHAAGRQPRLAMRDNARLQKQVEHQAVCIQKRDLLWFRAGLRRARASSLNRATPPRVTVLSRRRMHVGILVVCWAGSWRRRRCAPAGRARRRIALGHHGTTTRRGVFSPSRTMRPRGRPSPRPHTPSLLWSVSGRRGGTAQHHGAAIFSPSRCTPCRTSRSGPRPAAAEFELRAERPAA